MMGLPLFTIFFAMLVGTAVSKPLWSTLVGSNYLYSTPGINTHLAEYQNTHSPYYVYNIYSNAGGVPSALHVSGKPEISHVPAYNFYYGTPIYDIRIPLNPVYPVLTHPGIPPVFPSTTTEQSFDEDNYDGIEKLDTKVDLNKEIKKPEDSKQDDDSITVEAI